MIVCDYLLSGACFKAKAESNSAAGTRVATNPAAQALACGYGNVRLVAEGLGNPSPTPSLRATPEGF